MRIDKNVRSVVLVDKNGTPINRTSRHGFSQPSLERWNDIHFMECILEISMGAKFDDLYGPIRYHHSEKNNFIMFSFPFQNDVIIVTSTKNISPILLATKISYFINEKIPQL